MKRLHPYVRRPARSEHCLQAGLVRWCRGLGRGIVAERFAAIPNGGTRGADKRSRMIAGARLKAEGVRPGMPDLIFWRPGAVLFVEIKLGRLGRVSESQRAVLASLAVCWHQTAVCRTLAEAVDAIVEFYSAAK